MADIHGLLEAEARKTAGGNQSRRLGGRGRGGDQAFLAYGQVRRQISDVLALFADVVQPRTFEDFLRYGFGELPGAPQTVRLRDLNFRNRGVQRSPVRASRKARIIEECPGPNTCELIGQIGQEWTDLLAALIAGTAKRRSAEGKESVGVARSARKQQREGRLTTKDKTSRPKARSWPGGSAPMRSRSAMQSPAVARLPIPPWFRRCPPSRRGLCSPGSL